MFDVGFSELVVIALVALLVLGPERLPGAARTVGALVRRARASWLSLQGELERELGTAELKESLHSLKASADLGAVESELRQVAREVSAEIPTEPKPGSTAGEAATPQPVADAADKAPAAESEAAKPAPAQPTEPRHE